MCPNIWKMLKKMRLSKSKKLNKKLNSTKISKSKLKIKLLKKYKLVFLKLKQNKFWIFYRLNIDQ